MEGEKLGVSEAGGEDYYSIGGKGEKSGKNRLPDGGTGHA